MSEKKIWCYSLAIGFCLPSLLLWLGGFDIVPIWTHRGPGLIGIIFSVILVTIFSWSCPAWKREQ